MSAPARPRRLGVVDDPLAGAPQRAPADAGTEPDRPVTNATTPTSTVFARVPTPLGHALRMAAAHLSGDGTRVTQQQIVAALLRDALDPLDDAALDRLRSLIAPRR